MITKGKKSLNNYSWRYFYDSMPEWKRRKDPPVVKYIFRPLSFFGASFCARCGIQANTVSYFSGIIAIISAVLFIPNSYICHIIAAAFLSVWIWLDCVDGNLARSVKRQPFGDFADGLAGYLVLSLIPVCMGWAVYKEGGMFIEENTSWFLMIGAFASILDPLMRLIYQKYNYNVMKLTELEVIPKEVDINKDHSQVHNWKLQLSLSLGMSGILPLLILLCAITKTLDVAVMYCFICNLLMFVYSSLLYVRKAIYYAKNYSDKFETKYFD